MPRFSVIVPAYQVQAYLEECLDSVLAQSCPDLELIAVDDRSPDACGAIIDEYAARDPRVRPVHLEQNRGLGGARNAGMAEARGDYLVFLDGDDTLTPGALQAIADRVEETGEPDVLVYDYARTRWTGEAVRNKVAHLLTERGRVPFRLTDRPALLDVLMVAWNKACRRDFVEREGFTFPPGYYEDTPWTFPVLMAAGSLATLDRVCVHYRQSRRGSILGTVSRKHFDVFDQYDRVFAYVDDHPELGHWRPVLFRRMVDHLAVVYTRPDRLPRAARAEFLRRARAHCRRHRPAGVVVPSRSRLRHALVRLGLHRTYRALRLAVAVCRSALHLSARLARGLRAVLLRLHYGLQRCLPVRADRAVFTSHHDGGGYGGDPAALEAAFRTHAPHIRTAWVAPPEQHHTVPPGPRRLRPGSAAHLTALARARYRVDDAEPESSRARRRGQVVVQTRYGTPLGHTGLDRRERPAIAGGTDFDRLLAGVDTWDHVLSGNRHTTLTWERAYPGRYTVLEYGRPANDVFQRATAADVARLREGFGVPAGSVAILYVPARRAHRRTQRPVLDLDRLLGRLGPGFVALVRADAGHAGPQGWGDQVIDVSGRAGVESACLASDVLLTDYAPVMFDYAGLDRPIVLHTPDAEAHEAACGTYVDLRAFPPGPVARCEDELFDVFASGRWHDAGAAGLRAAFRERFSPHDDGRAAERVVRHVVLGEREGLPPVTPPAERRPAPAAVRVPAPVPAALPDSAAPTPAPLPAPSLAAQAATAAAAAVSVLAASTGVPASAAASQAPPGTASPAGAPPARSPQPSGRRPVTESS